MEKSVFGVAAACALSCGFTACASNPEVYGSLECKERAVFNNRVLRNNESDPVMQSALPVELRECFAKIEEKKPTTELLTHQYASVGRREEPQISNTENPKASFSGSISKYDLLSTPTPIDREVLTTRFKIGNMFLGFEDAHDLQGNNRERWSIQGGMNIETPTIPFDVFFSVKNEGAPYRTDDIKGGRDSPISTAVEVRSTLYAIEGFSVSFEGKLPVSGERDPRAFLGFEQKF